MHIYYTYHILMHTHITIKTLHIHITHIPYTCKCLTHIYIYITHITYASHIHIILTHQKHIHQTHTNIPNIHINCTHSIHTSHTYTHHHTSTYNIHHAQVDIWMVTYVLNLSWHDVLFLTGFFLMCCLYNRWPGMWRSLPPRYSQPLFLWSKPRPLVISSLSHT